MRIVLASILRPGLLALGVLLASSPAAAREEAKVLVVPVRGRAGPAFDAAVVRLVAKPLKRHATVLPPGAHRAALRRAHVGVKKLANLRAVQKVGRAAGAGYVLVVEATGRRPKLGVTATLTDVASGKSVFSDHYALQGGKLTAEVAAQMLSPVADRLTSEADGEGGDGEDTGGDAAPAKRGGKRGKLAFPGGAAGTDGEAADGEGGDADAAGTDEDADAAGKTGVHGSRWRPALKLAVGATFMRRTGTLTGPLPEGVTKLPCYCGDGNSPNPFFPGVRLEASFYPWALGGTGESALEGLGIFAQFFATQVKSYIASYKADGTLAAARGIISSVIVDVKAGVGFRYVFWDSPLAPDAEVRAGLSVFHFPLNQGTFPGVAYISPSLGLVANVPLGIEELALVGGFTVLPVVKAGDDAGNATVKMLGIQSSGSGLYGEGGLRFSFDAFEFKALARYESYGLKYSGPTALSINTGNKEKQTQNVGLNDTLVEILLTAGMNF